MIATCKATSNYTLMTTVCLHHYVLHIMLFAMTSSRESEEARKGVAVGKGMTGFQNGSVELKGMK